MRKEWEYSFALLEKPSERKCSFRTTQLRTHTPHVSSLFLLGIKRPDQHLVMVRPSCSLQQCKGKCSPPVLFRVMPLTCVSSAVEFQRPRHPSDPFFISNMYQDPGNQDLTNYKKGFMSGTLWMFCDSFCLSLTRAMYWRMDGI